MSAYVRESSSRGPRAPRSALVNVYRPKCLFTLTFLGATLLAIGNSLAGFVVPISLGGEEADLRISLAASGKAAISGPLPVSGEVIINTPIGKYLAVGETSLLPDGFTLQTTKNPTVLDFGLSPSPAKLVTEPAHIGLPRNGDGTFPAPASLLTFDDHHWTGATGLHYDLLQGETLEFDARSLSFRVTVMNPNPLYDGTPAGGPQFVDLSYVSQGLRMTGTLRELIFEQTPAAPTFTPTGAGIGTFSIPGNLHGLFDMEYRFGSLVIGTESDIAISTATALTGNYRLSGPYYGAALAISGKPTISLPLFARSLEVTNSTLYRMSLSVDMTSAFLDATLDYEFRTGTFVIPEPSSVLLLLIGAVALFAARLVRSNNLA